MEFLRSTKSRETKNGQTRPINESGSYPMTSIWYEIDVVLFIFSFVTDVNQRRSMWYDERRSGFRWGKMGEWGVGEGLYVYDLMRLWCAVSTTMHLASLIKYATYRHCWDRIWERWWWARWSPKKFLPKCYVYNSLRWQFHQYEKVFYIFSVRVNLHSINLFELYDLLIMIRFTVYLFWIFIVFDSLQSTVLDNPNFIYPHNFRAFFLIFAILFLWTNYKTSHFINLFRPCELFGFNRLCLRIQNFLIVHGHSTAPIKFKFI